VAGAAVLTLQVLQFLPLASELASRLGAPEGLLALPSWRLSTATPHASLAAALSTLPALVVVLLAGRLAADARWILVFAVLVVGALSLALGFVQLAQGPRSALRFFEVTNTTEAVGFFANRNHFAALMLATMVFAGTWLVALVGAQERDVEDNGLATLAIITAATLVVASLGGLTLARSRAGVLLAIPGMLGVMAMALRDTRLQRAVARTSIGGNRLVFVALVGGLALAVGLGLGGLQSRFGVDPLEDARLSNASITLSAITTSLPFGTGLASFVPVFAVAEKTDAIVPAFANRAHNDWLEWILETGVAGGALLLVFIGWYLVVTARAWTQRADGGERLARAASIVILLLMLHSLVDYPLRTTAMQAVFAMCCVLLMPVPPYAAPAETNSDGGSRALATVAAAAPPPAPVRWAGAAEWPDAWRKPPATRRTADDTEPS
jgi:O-antigen ligase